MNLLKKMNFQQRTQDVDWTRDCSPWTPKLQWNAIDVYSFCRSDRTSASLRDSRMCLSGTHALVGYAFANVYVNSMEMGMGKERDGAMCELSVCLGFMSVNKCSTETYVERELRISNRQNKENNIYERVCVVCRLRMYILFTLCT